MEALTKAGAPIEYCPSLDIHGGVLVCCPNKENILPTISLIKKEPIIEKRSNSVTGQSMLNSYLINFIIKLNGFYFLIYLS